MIPKSRPARAALFGAALLVLPACPALSQVTLDITNNFSLTNGGTYFGDHIEDQDVSIYFTGISGNDVTYNGGTVVTAGAQIQLSSVTGGTFNLSGDIAGARVYAILGSSAPATIPLPSGPDPVSVSSPYSFIELTTTPGGTADQSFLNQVSFPTSLSNGTQTNGWSSTATAQSIATAFHSAFPASPYAPNGVVAAGSGTPYSPYAPVTVTRSAGPDVTPINADRVIAASNVNTPAASPPTPPPNGPQSGTAYTNVPGFDGYLGWLQSKQAAQPNGGWKITYNSPGFANSTYVGYLTVTGSAGNYGLQISNLTYGGTFASGTMTGGTTVNGTITYAANNSTQNLFGATYTGNWTDMTIFGATDPTGNVVTTSGNLGALNIASVLYTVSASLGPGILGSDAYLTQGDDTDYFFKGGLNPSNMLTNFFAKSTFGGLSEAGYYDQYWYTMLTAGGVANGTYAGYFTPYDDHFSDLGVLMSSDSGTLNWNLGVALDGMVPEPGTWALLALGLGVILLARKKPAKS